MKSQCKLIVALDVPSRKSCLELLDRMGSTTDWVKIGLQLFTHYGPSIVEEIAKKGYKIFLDLKLHDIPNTVASAIKSLNTLPIGMLTLHASGGETMLAHAVQAQKEYLPETLLLGVTVLTSLDERELHATGVNSSPKDQVLRLAQLCNNAGVQGLVCSPQEIAQLRKVYGNTVKLVTPGIRPAGSNTNEQKRIMTPEQAASEGASYIVVGRPITQAENPQTAAQAVNASLRI